MKKGRTYKLRETMAIMLSALPIMITWVIFAICGLEIDFKIIKDFAVQEKHDE